MNLIAQSARSTLISLMLTGMLAVGAHAARAAEPAARVPSPVEAAFSERAGTALRAFGYDQLPDTPGGGGAAPFGSVQADYRLGSGDTLSVMLRGQKTATRRVAIDPEGRLLLEDLRPLTAAGRTLAELRTEVQAAMSAAHLDVEVFVSLAEVRRIGVYVLGPVRRPGRVEMTAFATVLDALAAAGGVTADGSLRRIRLVSAGGGERTVDLYRLLLPGGGGAADERLRDGDRVLVPPLGPTVAVAGAVKRPGVYELAADRGHLTLGEIRELAGGAVRPGPARALRLAIGGDGAERSQEVTDGDATLFGDGDLLLLTPRQENRRNTVRLEGHVQRPGPRDLAGARTLRGLVRVEELKSDPYLPFAVLISGDPRGRARTLRPIDLAALLDGGADPRLGDGDTLVVLGLEDVDYLTSEAVLALLRGGRPPPGSTCRGLEVLARTLSAEPDGTLARGPQARAAATMTGGTAPCPAVFDEHPDLLAFALTHATLVRSGVARPGFRPAARPAATGGGPATAAGVVDSDEPRVELLGHVRHPGVRPLHAAPTLRRALADGETVRPGVYPLLAVIERHDRRSLGRQFIPFSPQEVAAGRFDRHLTDRDRLHVLSAEQVRAVVAPATGDPRAPAAPVTATPITANGATAPFPDATAAPPQGSLAVPAAAGEPIDAAVAALFLERVVQVRGAVLRPGAYPVAGPTPLDALIDAADGATSGADLGAVEVTSAARRRLVDLARTDGTRDTVAPGDAIRVNAAPTALEQRAVVIAGAVRRPGAYDVTRGETLASLIGRAGGLTEEAYPAGTIFTRASERRRQKEEFEQDARAIERALVRAKAKGDAINPDDAQHTRQLVADLRGAEPLGRIVVEADPAVLRQRPELDVLLEADDRILIPKRPLTVAVAGEVLRPAALQFRTGKMPDDYIREAGGATRDADEDRTYLILPDGHAQPLALSAWNHRVTAVPPGSVVVVPRDPKPFDWLELSKNVGSILSSLAITAASVSVIAR